MTNAVNRAFMAKNMRYITLGLLLSATLTLGARNFAQNEEIYVNIQQDFDWSISSAKLYLYLFNSTGNTWLDLTQENGKIYKAVFPAAGSYSQLIVVRKNPSNPSHDWTGVWNQTSDIDIPADWNCIDNFADASHRWKMYSPALTKIAGYVASVSQEKVSVCPGSAGDPFSLKAKLNSTKTAYAYGDVHGHEWYRSEDKTNWTSMNNYAGKKRDGENLIDTVINLPKPTIPTGGIYYYLHSSTPAGRRLIYLKPDADKCELDCEITSFETAISAVNADDNTFTLDGMVAFGKASGDLVVECQGHSIVLLGDTIKSPQSFSLKGVPAATVSGQTTHATAYFQGDQTNCSKTITIDVPNAKEAVQVVSQNLLTGQDFTLTPVDAEPTNIYVWLVHNDQTGQLDTVHGAPQTLVVNGFGQDSTCTYIYKEYFPSNGTMEDLMTNGSYEDPTMDYGSYGKVSTISEYNFWGYFPQTANTRVNFYTDTLPGGVNPSKLNRNGFAVVKNANNFWQSYAPIVAHDGNSFALIDAETGAAGGNKRAWYATTASNPKLRLQKGTTYVLSFWAANINNYGEMDNAARFRFYIEDITDPVHPLRLDSSEVLDLSLPEYRNNLWHQRSRTFYAKQNCDSVRISVVNLNTNTLNIGNDFALDDIQFHPISSVSRVVKSEQQFVLTAYEPRVDAFSATTQNMLCSASEFTVNMQVRYRNAQGNLCVRDIDRDTVYLFTVPAKAVEEQGTYNFSIVLRDALAGVHNWEAYFAPKPANKQTAQSLAPVRYSCDILDTTICEGETVTWKGTTYPLTPYIGTDTFTSGYDSLMLTIHAIPRITVGTIDLTCDDATEVRIPFIVTNGNPNTFDIAVGANHYAGTISGTDLVFTPAKMDAGDYTATITIGETANICETTATVNYTIALSDQVYSKWTDVLFVSNQGDQYVAYQWYADGLLMPGETQQRLYDPNGLSGSPTLYHCQLTTVNGATLYTCPLTFDQAKASRTQTPAAEVVPMGVYDAMGRPVTSPLTRGIYIVVEMVDGELMTRKLIVNE